MTGTLPFRVGRSEELRPVAYTSGYDLRDARLRELREQIAALTAPADMQRIEAQR